MSKERENSATLENYIKTTDSACNTSTRDLEELLQQKEQDINHLYNELHEVTKKFTNCNQRARGLEAELERCSAELQIKTEELLERENEVENMMRDMDALRGSLADAQEQYKKEAAKSEKLKTAVMLCNNKMIELEKASDGQRVKIRSLEQKLESVQTEVKSKTAELEAVKRRKTIPNTDVDSFSVPNASSVSKKGAENPPALTQHSGSSPSSPLGSLGHPPKSLVLEAGENFSSTDHDTVLRELKKCREELCSQHEKNLKLKAEQFKACQIIKSMMSKREQSDRETGDLKRQIEALRDQMRELKGDGAELHKTKSLHSKLSEMKFTAAGSTSSPDNEVLLMPKSKGSAAKTARACRKN